MSQSRGGPRTATAIALGLNGPLMKQRAAYGEVEVDCCVPNSIEALAVARKRRPNIFLVDFETVSRLAGMHRELRRLGEVAPVILISCKHDALFVDAGIEGNVRGMLLDSELTQLKALLNEVVDGQVAYSRSVRDGLAFLANGTQIHDPMSMELELTLREWDILRGLATGLSVRQIAAGLCLSPKTVDTYRTSMMRKLDIHDRVRLTRFAIRRGIVAV